MAAETQERKERLLSIGLTVLFAVLMFSLIGPPAGAETRELTGSRTAITAIILLDSPPIYFQDPKTRKAAGFAVDVMDEVARRAGLSVTYRFEKDWEDSINAVRTGKADIAPVMGITEKRQDILAFTSTVITFPLVIFTRSEDKAISELRKGLTVGVISGSVAYEIIKKKHGTVSLRTFESYSDGLFNLLAGNIDAFCCAASTLTQLAREAGVEDRIKIVGAPLMEFKLGMAMRKDDAKLLSKLNAVIAGYVGSPEYQQTYTKWFGKPKPFLTVSRKTLLTIVMIFLVTAVMTFWRHQSIMGLTRKLQDEITERTRVEDTLRESNTMLQTLIHAIPDQVFFKDSAGHYVLVNKAMEKTLGLAQEAFVGKTDDDLSPPDVAEKCKRSDAEAIKKGGPVWSDESYTDKNGEMRFLDVVKAPIYDNNGEPKGLVVVSRDITDRKRTEEENVRKTLMLDIAPSAITVHDFDGRFLYANQKNFELHGYSRDEFMSLTLHEIDVPATAELIASRMQELRERGEATFQVEHRRKDGTTLPLEVYTRVTSWGDTRSILSIATDITERKKVSDLILRSLKEKEVMLKEIHHRVKNNMQVIYSLLNLQAKSVADQTVRALLEEGRDRVLSMALMHEKLYQSKDLAHIDFREYLEGLLHNIASTYNRHDVVIDLDMEPVVLDVTLGIPCGLIVNELVSNSHKYAFPDEGTGTITVGLTNKRDGNYVLTVADNGVGFPETVDFRNTASLGLQLVNVLAGQIHGTIDLSRAEGTTFSITFPGFPEISSVKM